MKTICAICLISGLALVQADPTKPRVPETEELVKALGPETEELAKAVAVATAKLKSTVTSPSDYKLIKVELVRVEGEDLWRTIYKLSRLIPENSGELIGLGGEVFVSVDLKKGQATLQHGE